jgi:Predicted membrane protein (DUF2306)
MATPTVLDPRAFPSPSRRGTTALLSVASLIAIAFFAFAALPYFMSSSYNASEYAGRRGWLLVHIVGGTIALFSGPIQLWLGIADRRIDLHRKLGLIEQHKEWMIRSYVVTFSFVTYRLSGMLMGPFELGTFVEINIVLAWGSWALPLLATEAILQGRKLAAVHA